MSQPAIEVSQLELDLGGAPILRGLDFPVAQGGTTCIIGPNGAGKSTLLKCLAGIHRDYRGRITLGGRDLRGLHPRALARQLAYVPQAADALAFDFTVGDFIWLGRHPHLSPFTWPRQRDREAVARAMELADVGRFADRGMATLSGGERQRVMIAAAMAQQARILLLDEPTAFLDYQHQDEVLELMQRLIRDRSATLVVVTHDVNTPLLAGADVLALDAGRLVCSGAAGQLLNEERLEQIYHTRFRFIDDPGRGRRVVAPREGRPA